MILNPDKTINKIVFTLIKFTSKSSIIRLCFTFKSSANKFPNTDIPNKKGNIKIEYMFFE